MIYVITLALVIISHILGSYFSIQGLRGPVNRPIIYKSEIVIFLLVIIFGWIPLILALYISVTSVGIIYSFFLLILKTLILPSVFNLKKFMDNRGF